MLNMLKKIHLNLKSPAIEHKLPAKILKIISV